MQPLLRVGFQPGADPAGTRHRHAQSGAKPRRLRGRTSGDVALKPAPENAVTHWYHAPHPVVTPAEEELKNWRNCCATPAISH